MPNAGHAGPVNREWLRLALEEHVRWLAQSGDPQLRRLDLTGHVLSGDMLKGANLRCAILRYVDLGGCDLTGTDFSGADLTGSRLSDLKAPGAHFEDTNLRDVDFRSSVLTNASFLSAKMYGARLTDTWLRDTVFSRVHGVRYASVGFTGHGEGGRLLTVVKINKRAVFFCGCFRGSEIELWEFIRQGNPQLRASRRLALKTVLMLYNQRRAPKTKRRTSR